MPGPRSALFTGIARKKSESGNGWQVFRVVYCHIKFHLCGAGSYQDKTYDATAALAVLPRAKTTAISIRVHACQIERPRYLKALSCFTVRPRCA